MSYAPTASIYFLREHSGLFDAELDELRFELRCQTGMDFNVGRVVGFEHKVERVLVSRPGSGCELQVADILTKFLLSSSFCIGFYMANNGRRERWMYSNDFFAGVIEKKMRGESVDVDLLPFFASRKIGAKGKVWKG